MTDLLALALFEPTEELHGEILALIDEFAAAGEHHYRLMLGRALLDMPGYVGQLLAESRGRGLQPGYVPQTTFWTLDDDHRIAGIVHFRHRLTPELEYEGGHIGYFVRPSLRGQGYGTCQLALMLEHVRKAGLRRVLVTCDADNLASARVIEKNGGRLTSQDISYHSRKLVSRYWIEL